MKRHWLTGVAAGLLIAPLAFSPAHSDDFYEGQTITIVVGAGGGSLSDGAQIVARHLGKYIPGNPTVIHQQMPGGAHQIATNHVYNAADKDGLTILAANPNVGVAQLSKVETVRFDVTQFQWLGSTGADGALFAVRESLPYDSFEEWLDSGEELVAGTTGPGSNAHDYPMLLSEFAGANLNLVPGYPANSDILLALEREEVDAWSALTTTVRQAVERGSVKPFVRTRATHPDLEHLPVDEDLTDDPIGKALFRIRSIPLGIGRAYAVAPEVPEERVEMLREALVKVMEDPDFIAESETALMTLQFIPGDEITANFEDLMDQPSDVMEAFDKYLKVQ